MKTTRDYIKEIKIDTSNLSHIQKTGRINGSLLLAVEKAMKEYAIEVAKEALINASEGFSEWLVCKNVEDSHKKQILSETNIPELK